MEIDSQLDTVSPTTGEQSGKTYEQMTVSERAEFIPQQLFDYRKNEPAFIFSRENLRSIKRYELTVRRLPADKQVQASEQDYLLVGVKATDVQVFFGNLRKHADRWNILEDSCKEMSAQLHVFAEELCTEGDRFIDEVKGTEAWGDSGATAVKDLETVPQLPLSLDDAQTFSEAVETYLHVIKNDILVKLERIRNVRALVDDFDKTISKNLRPMADGLVSKFSSEAVGEQIVQIERDLAKLDVEIDEKISEYDGLVGSAFYGLIFGPVGLIVTGGIYGSQAEEVRAHKNRLIVDRDALLVKREKLISGPKDIDQIKTILVDLRMRLVDVSTAAKNLEDVWVLLEVYAEQSLSRVKSVDTDLQLRRFIRKFEQVISPWQHIKGISKDVSRLFNETVDEF